ncbi:unnamed protein product [Symbiodinium sp. CCMP2456]|nr:unnamed protein product [Symbiodinium sp. CCMP2456]
MLLEALLPLGALAVYQATYEAAVLRNIEEGYAQTISISGDALVVGAPAEGSGVVYVYLLSAGQWLQELRLVPSDAAVGDRFGSSLKLSGDYLVVGASGHDVDSLSETGSAYIFTRSSGWQQQAKLLANDTNPGDRFGVAVAVTEEGHVLVGADWHTGLGGPGSGAAYVFRRDDTATGWSQEAKLTASDAVPFDRFGSAVAMSGSYAIVGAWEADAVGAAYIFERTLDGWSQAVRYEPTGNSTEGDMFGSVVAISGDTAVVGAHWDDGEDVNGGAAYIYTRNATGWDQGMKVYADGTSKEDRFGIAVDVSGNAVIIGAYFDSDHGIWSGSAYILAQLGGVWSFQEKLTWSNASAGDFFGQSVSIWDSQAGPFTAAVGAPGGNCSLVFEGGLPTTTTTTTRTLSSTSSSSSSLSSTSTSTTSQTTSSTTSRSSTLTSTTSITSTTTASKSSTTTTSSATTSRTSTRTTSTSSSATLTSITSSSLTQTTSTKTATTRTSATITATTTVTKSWTSTSTTRTRSTTTARSITTTRSTTPAPTAAPSGTDGGVVSTSATVISGTGSAGGSAGGSASTASTSAGATRGSAGTTGFAGGFSTTSTAWSDGQLQWGFEEWEFDMNGAKPWTYVTGLVFGPFAFITFSP